MTIEGLQNYTVGNCDGFDNDTSTVGSDVE